jgi:hypothetical protein
MDKEFGQSQAMLLKKRGVTVYCNSMVNSIVQGGEGLTVNFTRKEKEEQVTAQGGAGIHRAQTGHREPVCRGACSGDEQGIPGGESGYLPDIFATCLCHR